LPITRPATIDNKFFKARGAGCGDYRFQGVLGNSLILKVEGSHDKNINIYSIQQGYTLRIEAYLEMTVAVDEIHSKQIKDE
jgi:hypothetical protein